MEQRRIVNQDVPHGCGAIYQWLTMREQNGMKMGIGKMRILGLDYGTKTVGVAVSDALLLTAQPVETIQRESPKRRRRTLARIEELVHQYQVDRIVLGYPKNMNDTEGPRCEATCEFKEELERRTGLPVILWDERLTTVAADEILMETGVRRENRKQYIDQIAAVLILQEYLDSLAAE